MIFLSSTAAYQPVAFEAVYGASKAFNLMFVPGWRNRVVIFLMRILTRRAAARLTYRVNKPADRSGSGTTE